MPFQHAALDVVPKPSDVLDMFREEERPDFEHERACTVVSPKVEQLRGGVSAVHPRPDDDDVKRTPARTLLGFDFVQRVADEARDDVV